ncbi:MAG: hypothetical protein ACKOUM_09205, partial [Sphingopyxis sp.]
MVMRPRQPPHATTTTRPRGGAAMRVPSAWLMVDARLGHALARIIAAMPPRSAIVVRPYALPVAGRAGVLAGVRRAARARRHWLLLAGNAAEG